MVRGCVYCLRSTALDCASSSALGAPSVSTANLRVERDIMDRMHEVDRMLGPRGGAAAGRAAAWHPAPRGTARGACTPGGRRYTLGHAPVASAARTRAHTGQCDRVRCDSAPECTDPEEEGSRARSCAGSSYKGITQPSVAAEARHHARLVTRGSTHPGVILSRTVPPAPLLERQG